MSDQVKGDGSIQEVAGSDSGPIRIMGRAEIHDNWYVLKAKDDGRPVAIGVYLPPSWADVAVEKIEVGAAAEIIRSFILETIGPDAAGFHSARVASNNRLLMVGRWTPGDEISGLQFDRLMPDQARDLLGELIARAQGPSLVGVIEIRG